MTRGLSAVKEQTKVISQRKQERNLSTKQEEKFYEVCSAQKSTGNCQAERRKKKKEKKKKLQWHSEKRKFSYVMLSIKEVSLFIQFSFTVSVF